MMMTTTTISPKQKRVGVGVNSGKSVVWAVTFLAVILLSADALSPRLENGGRRRVRGAIRGGHQLGRISSSPSTPTTVFDLEESKRLLRLESASPISYLYRYRAPRTIAPPSSNPPTQPTPFEEDPSSSSPIFTSVRSQPRVFLRSNGQSGVIQRRISSPAATTTTPTTTTTSSSTTTTTHDFPSSEEEREISNEKSDKVFEPELQNVVEDDHDHDYYPYHYYLDFDKSKQPQKSEYLHPQPSEHLKPYALPDTQSSLWNEFLQHHTQTNSDDSVQAPTYIPPPPTPPPVYLNEINDNYTIPALRDYRFPDFKSITTTTIKPPKHNFLNPYEFFSEEDLENVADLDFDSDHSKYFVKTKPRDVSASVANLYNSFYYEPPSYSTKSQPLPVKATFPQPPLEEKAKQWTRVENNNDLDNFNYFDGSSLVTFPMSTATTTSTTTPTATANFLNFPTTTMSSRNQSEYYFSPQVKSDEKSQSDVATAESIAILAASKSSNINLIPDDDTFVHKDGKILADVTMATTTTPKMDLYMPTTTPSSGSDKDTTNIPGMPGVDYPIFDEIPVTGFDCAKQRYKGFFADIESKCQVWHYCDFADGHSSFLCPNGTLFSQVLLTCDWWFNVDCIQAQQLYVLNERLYRYIKPPKPSFPEDYHGPGVDLWLKKQLELGLLPKIKKGRKQLEKPVPTTLKEKVEDTSPPSTTTTATTTTTTTPEPSSSLEDEKNE
ncbi:uncharacterized protein LOC110852849 isoform X2 [Folsomia candida]|nr:uncharacterized protein LOC110852849 isoform X2 [Folsomia candida]XP_035710089.1 uncharacterized protein LOC110852849 isoform X2 [Folsomia candida]